MSLLERSSPSLIYVASLVELRLVALGSIDTVIAVLGNIGNLAVNDFLPHRISVNTQDLSLIWSGTFTGGAYPCVACIRIDMFADIINLLKQIPEFAPCIDIGILSIVWTYIRTLTTFVIPKLIGIFIKNNT